MTELDKIVDANEEYSHDFKYGTLPIPPARKLAVLACMDARLNVNEALVFYAALIYFNNLFLIE